MSLALDQQVLVLNRLWQAVNVCSVRRALTLLFEGHAQVVWGDEDGDFKTFNFSQWRDLSHRTADNEEKVATVSFSIRVPRVILLMVFDQLPAKEATFTGPAERPRMWTLGQFCGRIFERKDLNLDHVVPRDRGGPTTWENIVCSCIPCNTRKANRTPAEAGIRLIRKPKRPKWRPFVQVSFGAPVHESWKHFLDIAYWNVELGEELG